MRRPLTSTAAVIDSDEDERTNDVSEMLGRLKFPTTTPDDYELAKLIKEKLSFLDDDEDAAMHLAKALREFKFQKNAANGIASRTSENSNENETTPASAMPIETTKYPMKQSPLPEQSKTPPRSSKKSSKPWDSALDRRAPTSTNASASKPRGRTSPFRHNSAREMSDCPARSKSPLRRFFSLRSAMGTTDSSVNDTNPDPVGTATAKVASSVSCAPNAPVGVSSTPRNAGVPQSPDLFTPVDTKKSTLDCNISPPSTCGFSFTSGTDTPIANTPGMNSSPFTDTPGMADTPRVTENVFCATGAHKNRRTTTTPSGLGPVASLEAQFQSGKGFVESTTSFANSTSNLHHSFMNTTSSFIAQGDIRFHVGCTSAKKPHNRLDKVKSRRAKVKPQLPSLHVPPPNVFGGASETSTTPTSDVRTSSGLFSPMDVDEVIQEEQPAVQPAFVQPAVQPQNLSIPDPAPFPSVVTGFEFNIGATDKSTTPSKGRGRRNPGRKIGGSPTAGVSRRAPPSQLPKGPQKPSEPHNFNDQSIENAASSTASTDVFYEGNRAYVKSLREEARHFYMKEAYKSSVVCYTKALKVHTHDTGILQEIDDVRAVLLANRGAALMMMTAYWAAVHDCEEALKFISVGVGGNRHLPSDGGPILRCKVLIRLGRSHLKLGNLEQAERAFQLAAETESSARCFVTKGHNSEAYLAQTITDASMGKTEAKQCRDLVLQLEQLEMTSLDSPSTASRRNNLQALSLVNTALSMSSGSMDLHSMQVAILAALKRWREVAGCCERLAAELTRFDGVFNEDLAELNPFPGVSPASSLDPTFFEGDDIKIKKISSKNAVVDVVLRLPRNMLRFYIRALRLEERYPLALAAITALEAHSSQNSTNHTSYPWLKREKDKLERTMKSKERGDMLYVEGRYDAATEFYSACMLIDGEGLAHDPSSEGSNGGGKLHAVLHCNRAACHMSTEKYLEAIKDCSMALRIHTHYMKAMLRRSRCYVRLARYEEATAEYERYIQLVSEYRKEGVYETTSCLFDGPKEVSSENVDAVKMELDEVKRLQINQENAARAEKVQKEQRQKWYSENFGKAKPGDNAHSRRDQWYSQQGANEPRRWDSFNGRGPHPNGNSGRGPSWRQHSSRDDSSRRGEPKSNFAATPPSTNPGSENHYSVLQLSVNATESEIKKGYRVMALKYHPDKNQDADASDMFRRIKLAYDVLSDPVSRRKYDAENRFSRRF